MAIRVTPQEISLPNRQSIRLKGWDYSSPGWYFVTACAQDMRPVFGTVVNGRVALNETGRMVREMWLAVGTFHPEYRLDEFVVMPNHVHGLVHVTGTSGGAPETGRPDGLQTTDRPDGPQTTGRPDGLPLPGSLPDFMRRFKSTADVAWRNMFGAGASDGAGRRACPTPDTQRNGKLWQRNYWDVIVRDERALANIRRYIRENPQNYREVAQGGEPRALGNLALLESPKLGFLASRGQNGLHGALPLKPGEAVISGFLSPMERAVFRAALAAHRPVIWVKPWALEEGIDTPEVHSALAGGRLLILSPFAEHEAPAARRAAWCNAYVMHHCNRLVLGRLTPGGMLECLLSDAPAGLEVSAL